MTAHEAITLRRATAGDAAALEQFYNGLSPAAIRTFRPLGTATAPEACERVVAGNVSQPERGYDLLALRGDVVVGWCFLWDLHTAKPVFGLGIGDGDRGEGLGGRMMDHVMDEAQRRALPLVELTVVTDNDVAWRLYAKRGFVRYDEYVDTSDGLAYYRMRWQPR